MSVNQLERKSQEKALAALEKECREGLMARFPKVDFDGTAWDFRKIKGAPKCDYYWFGGLTPDDGRTIPTSWQTVYRCLAYFFIFERAKLAQNYDPHANSVNLLVGLDLPVLFNLSQNHHKQIRDDLLQKAKENPASAQESLKCVKTLETEIIPLLVSKGVIDAQLWREDKAWRKQLITIKNKHAKEVKAKKFANLEAKIGALSDLITACYNNDERLTPAGHIAAYAMAIDMTCPSRINEVLAMSIDDVHLIEADEYNKGDIDQANQTLNVHRLLLGMKGSKGASWKPKPALNFMMELCKLSIDRVVKLGERSRMLIKHYQQNPDILYLPANLQHLKELEYWGTHEIAQAMYLLDSSEVDRFKMSAAWAAVKKHLPNPADLVITIDNPRAPKDSRGKNKINAWPREAIEKMLVKRVHEAIEECRRVTNTTRYEGDVANRLFLFDYNERTPPHLPGAVDYQYVSIKLKPNASNKCAKSAFQMLGLTMPFDGQIVDAHIETHDGRTFLQNLADKHAEGISDAILNQWANRLSIEQLNHYIKHDNDHLAKKSAMPDMPPDIGELTDISDALAEERELLNANGISTTFVQTSEHALNISSISAIKDPTQRALARQNGKLIVIYPTKAGMCLNQHHLTPCINYNLGYSIGCLKCSENRVAKGDIPAKEHIDETYQTLFDFILAQLEPLIVARNRGEVEDLDAMDQNILALVGSGLNAEEMTELLINEFHDIKDLIVDSDFRERVHDAFIAKGFKQHLEDENTHMGSLISYNNPEFGPNPLAEINFQETGGQQAIDDAESRIREQYGDNAKFLEPVQGDFIDQSDSPLLGCDDDEQEEAA